VDGWTAFTGHVLQCCAQPVGRTGCRAANLTRSGRPVAGSAGRVVVRARAAALAVFIGLGAGRRSRNAHIDASPSIAQAEELLGAIGCCRSSAISCAGS
jgi:hypothetical protein